MSIEDINYLYKNSVKENIIIKINSSERDKNIYPNPNNYKLTFTEPFKYVYGIDILDAALPRTQYQIDNHNNELYFYNNAIFPIIIDIDGTITIELINTRKYQITDNGGVIGSVNDEFIYNGVVITGSAGQILVEAGTSLVNGSQYKIKKLGNINWNDISGGVSEDDEFIYNGEAITGLDGEILVEAGTSLVNSSQYKITVVDDVNWNEISISTNWQEISNETLTYPYVGQIFTYNDNTITGSGGKVKTGNGIEEIEIDVNDYNLDDLMINIQSKIDEREKHQFKIRLISLTVPTNNTNIFYFDNQDSNNPFYIFAYKSTISEVIGLDKYTQPSSNNHRQFSKTDDSVVWQLIQDETEYTEIEKINHTYKSINIDRAELSYPTRGTNVNAIIPDMINLTGDRFIKLRCNAIEKYLPSYYSGSNSIGLGLFKLSVSGYTDEKFDFTSVEYKDLHPIGKFASIDLKFEMLNGKLYDFKGVDHHFLLNIKYYVPTKNNNNVNKKDYVLNTNYNPNLLDYKRTQYEKDDNSEDEINELANNFKKNFLEKEKEYEYSSDEDLDFINPYIDSSGSESSIDTSSEEENGITPFHPSY